VAGVITELPMLPIQSADIQRPATRAARAGAKATPGFRLPENAGAATPLATAEAATALDGLLAMQEQSVLAGTPSEAADRQARRHSAAVLCELAALQRDLLRPCANDRAGHEATSALQRLTALVAETPDARDPGTRGLLAAVTLRARIELTRRLRR